MSQNEQNSNFPQPKYKLWDLVTSEKILTPMTIIGFYYYSKYQIFIYFCLPPDGGGYGLRLDESEIILTESYASNC